MLTKWMKSARESTPAATGTEASRRAYQRGRNDLLVHNQLRLLSSPFHLLQCLLQLIAFFEKGLLPFCTLFLAADVRLL